MHQCKITRRIPLLDGTFYCVNREGEGHSGPCEYNLVAADLEDLAVRIRALQARAGEVSAEVAVAMKRQTKAALVE